MSLSKGDRLGGYEILSPLGAGGMGEVHRARDTRLGREVAVKVLPDGFAQDPERLARFAREAKLLASLNHPGIATLYGVEESGSTRFLVMELVEGETLAERLERGPLKPDEARTIFLQIGEALDAAHEKGIIHRDLKPANVKITPGGRVKLLDFGLGKALVSESAGGSQSESPTFTRSATETGIVLGTAPYMSPEQARGRPVDRRTDVWAFGCCLYESLSARKAFYGETVTDTLSAILSTEPDFRALPASAPRGTVELIRRCLEKDPRQRLRDIGDAWLELSRDPERLEKAGSPVSPYLWIATSILLLTVGLVLGRALSPAAGPSPTRYLSLTLPGGERLQQLWSNVVALSPDGTELIYAATSPEGVQRLYRRSLEAPGAEPILGTEGAFEPFFSPDGQFVGFSADGQMAKLSRHGGAPTRIGEAGGYGASWGPDDTIVFSGRSGTGLMRVSAQGGEPVTITRPDFHAGADHQRPSFLPGGKAVLFDVVKTGIAVWNVETGEWKMILEQGTGARYVPTGHVVFGRGASLLAAPFDIEKLATRGGPVTVVEGVRIDGDSGTVHYDFSKDGTLVFVPGTLNHTAPRRLMWVDRSGNARALTDEERAYAHPRISPDGESVAVMNRVGIEYVIPGIAGGSDIWIVDVLTGTARRLTFDGRSFVPIWSPDSAFVTFLAKRGSVWRALRKRADGSGQEEVLYESEVYFEPTSTSPDGKTLFFSQPDASTDWDIWMLGPTGETTPRVRTPLYEDFGQPSPDGRWLSFVRADHVFVAALEDAGGIWQISPDPAPPGVWSPDGRELFYRNGKDVLSVPVRSEPTFSPGRPVVLFADRFDYLDGSYRNFDVAPDGEHFVFVDGPEEEEPRSFTVVLNWHEELKRLVPVK